MFLEQFILSRSRNSLFLHNSSIHHRFNKSPLLVPYTDSAESSLNFHTLDYVYYMQFYIINTEKLNIYGNQFYALWLSPIYSSVSEEEVYGETWNSYKNFAWKSSQEEFISKD